MRAKNPTAPRISIAGQIHVLRVSSEERDAWDTRLLGAAPIGAIRPWAPGTRRSGSSAAEIVAKGTLHECHRALVGLLYSHPQMLRPCWVLAF